MFSLALRSLAKRPGRFLAGFLAVFLGAAVVMAFGSLLDTALAGEVSDTDEETLITMASVVGGWGLALVVFAVAATMTLTVRQRAAELALLKSTGATPAQVGRLIVGETLLVALGAAVLAIVPGALLGRLLVGVLGESGQITSGIDHTFGPIGLSMGIGNAVTAALLGAALTARRAARTPAVTALTDAATEGAGGRSMGPWRWLGAVLALAGGTALAVVTATVMDGKGTDVMQTAGPAVVVSSIALALLSPVLLRAVTAVLAGPVRLLAGASGALAVTNVRRRTAQLAGAVMPVVLFTGISAGTISMQRVESTRAAAEGAAVVAEGRTSETLNYVVVGIIAAFCCIMLVNTLVSATVFRRREFGRQRLAGATPGQVSGMVAAEGALIAVTGVLAGLLASLAALVPFSMARTGEALPGDGAVLAIHGTVVALALLVTLATGVGTARRTVRRTPAVESVLAA
ncbi:FtsX-like permease family protein [Streptomyces litchfieldiae]|uniref:FtsX-like permease family protein n=1 Tax=Streptomyces litchfieldiae TaxID=3075543 RepID=A0ABU2MM85_9ACTN|nr:FtsX-like permease family protein [Streptomyces sp. DSM 44938]MDT0342478.1 FtsX-like permease family protein [Streptomyces sp. DSM 44938]